jgi:hypothetical protein
MQSTGMLQRPRASLAARATSRRVVVCRAQQARAASIGADGAVLIGPRPECTRQWAASPSARWNVRRAAGPWTPAGGPRPRRRAANAWPSGAAMRACAAAALTAPRGLRPAPSRPPAQQQQQQAPAALARRAAAAAAAALLALAPAAGPAAANEFDILGEPTPTSSYFIDDASVLSKATRSELNKKLRLLEARCAARRGAGCCGGAWPRRAESGAARGPEGL